MADKRIWVMSKRLHLILLYPERMVKSNEKEFIRLKAYYSKNIPKDHITYRELSRNNTRELNAIFRGFKYYVLRKND